MSYCITAAVATTFYDVLYYISSYVGVYAASASATAGVTVQCHSRASQMCVYICLVAQSYFWAKIFAL